VFDYIPYGSAGYIQGSLDFGQFVNLCVAPGTLIVDVSGQGGSTSGGFGVCTNDSQCSGSPPATTTTTTTAATTTTTAATTTTTAVCYSSTLGLSGVQGSISGACSAAAQFTYYVGGTKLYTDSGCGTFADAGYYGDGGGVYYQVTGAGNLTGPTSCPGGTTTTTAAPTTTTTAAPTTTTTAATTTTTAAATTTTTTCVVGCLPGTSTCIGDAAVCDLQNDDCTITYGYLVQNCDPGCCSGGACIC